MYDYTSSNALTRFRGERNGLPVILQIQPLKNVSFREDLEQMMLCPGVADQEVGDKLHLSKVLVEKSGEEIILRSRDCEQILGNDWSDDTCEACHQLKETKHSDVDIDNAVVYDNNIEPRNKEEEVLIEEENEPDKKDQEYDHYDKDLVDEFVVRESEANIKRNKKNRKSKLSIQLTMGARILKPSGLHYACFFCGKLFDNEADYKRHDAEWHTIDEKFKCPGCEFLDENKKTVIHHIRDSFETHEEHFKKHYGGCPNIFKCPECEESFVKKSRLLAHLKNVHKKVIPANICPICEFKVAPAAVGRHMSTFHQGGINKCLGLGKGGALHCEGLVFSNLLELKKHNQFFHNPQDINTCHVCGKSFEKMRHSFYIKHVLSHEMTEKNFKCQNCDKKFLFQTELNEHESNECTLETCPYCSKIYKSLRNLRRHIHTVHSDQVHKCKICGKSFWKKSRLDSHLLSHSTVRPFSCKLCTKCFKSSEDLGNHLKTHTLASDLFYCDHCTDAFDQKYNLDFHVNKYHMP